MQLHSQRFFNLVFIFIYILVAVYIILFRVIYDVVGSNEPEHYPLEIITTIAVILSFILAYLIFYENKRKTKKIDKLYLVLFIFFLAYFLAENNWLLGREYFIGTVFYAIFAGIIFILIMIRIYKIDRNIFIIFLLGTICLALGTIIDAIIDDYIPIALTVTNRILYEEIPEIYASLLFLHSLLLLYFHLTRESCRFVLDKRGASIIVICSIIIGYGNSYLLYDHGKPMGPDRLVIGIILCLVGLIFILGYFMYYRTKNKAKYWHDIGE